MMEEMTPETRKALKGSIKKWEKIVKSTKAVDKGKKNCPLCSLFFQRYCGGCPVKESMGEEYCVGTPYATWCMHQEEYHMAYIDLSRHPNCPDCLRLAKAELEFLKGLLPKKREEG